MKKSGESYLKNSLLVLGGTLLGTGLMYLFDPERGTQRRQNIIETVRGSFGSHDDEQHALLEDFKDRSYSILPHGEVEQLYESPAPKQYTRGSAPDASVVTPDSVYNGDLNNYRDYGLNEGELTLEHAPASAVTQHSSEEKHAQIHGEQVEQDTGDDLSGQAAVRDFGLRAREPEQN